MHRFFFLFEGKKKQAGNQLYSTPQHQDPLPFDISVILNLKKSTSRQEATDRRWASRPRRVSTFCVRREQFCNSQGAFYKGAIDVFPCSNYY